MQVEIIHHHQQSQFLEVEELVLLQLVQLTLQQMVIRFIMTDNGIGFGTAPIVTVAVPAAGVAADRAIGIASLEMLVKWI